MNNGINKDIIKLIEERLAKGQKTYGQQVQKNDTRDFTKEALEEVLDGMVYTAAQLIQLKSKLNPNKRKLRLGDTIQIGKTKYLVATKEGWGNDNQYHGLFNLNGGDYPEFINTFSCCRPTLLDFEEDLRMGFGKDLTILDQNG